MKNAPRDLIRLNGIKCLSRLGVPEAERRKPQPILVDLALELDTAPAAAKDDFRLTADYWAIEKTVRKTAQTGQRRLVETLAHQIAAAVLRQDKRVSALTVCVHKKPAAMPNTSEVVVEIRRFRKT